VFHVLAQSVEQNVAEFDTPKVSWWIKIHAMLLGARALDRLHYLRYRQRSVAWRTKLKGASENDDSSVRQPPDRSTLRPPSDEMVIFGTGAIVRLARH
jgi:hypothetical protein